MHLVNKAKEGGVPVVVAGCVSQADRNLKGLEDVSVVGVSQIGFSCLITFQYSLLTWFYATRSRGGSRGANFTRRSCQIAEQESLAQLRPAENS